MNTPSPWKRQDSRTSRNLHQDWSPLGGSGQPHGDGSPDLLHLVVEITGYRRENAKAKASTIRDYWVPDVNNLGNYGRWAFAEFAAVYEMLSDLKDEVEAHFNAIF